MKYRSIPTFLSMLVYAAGRAPGVARICEDHRVLRSLLVLAAIMNITLVALFFFRFCFESADHFFWKHKGFAFSLNKV